MKKRFLLILTIIFMALCPVTSCSRERDYGTDLPPEFPANIPIIQGDIEESRWTRFETDNGYIVGINANLSYDETVTYFKDAFKDRGVDAEFREAINMSGTSQKMMSVEAQLDQDIILIEITSDNGSTYVNYAVHLGK